MKKPVVLGEVLKLPQSRKMLMFAHPQNNTSKQKHPPQIRALHPVPLPRLLGPLAENALRCRNASEKRV